MNKLKVDNILLSKIILIFVVLSIVPICIIGYMSTKTSADALIDEAKNSFQSSTMQTSKYFDLVLKNIEDISRQISINDSVQSYSLNIIEKNKNYFTEFTDKQSANDLIDGFLSANSAIANISILLDDGNSLGAISKQSDMETIRNSSWYKKVDKASTKSCWLSDYSQGIMNKHITNRFTVSYVRQLETTFSIKKLGLIFIDIKYDEFSVPLSEIHLGKEDLTCLITEEGKVFSPRSETLNIELSNKSYIKEAIKKSQTNSNGLFEINESDFETNIDTEYLVSYYKSKVSAWTVVSIISKKEITEGSLLIRNQTIVWGIIFIILSIIFGGVFVKTQISLKRSEIEANKNANLANTDGLTGLNNRRHLFELGQHVFETAKKNNCQLTVMMMDIDHFKRFNDNYGHDIGDEVLKFVSTAIVISVRNNDIVGRYGGEEFGVILPGTDIENAVIVAERIRSSVENIELVTEKFGELKCSVSIGIAKYDGVVHSIEDMLKCADSMLYKAKKNGRNRIEWEI